MKTHLLLATFAVTLLNFLSLSSLDAQEAATNDAPPAAPAAAAGSATAADTEDQAVRAQSEALVAAYNEGDADALAALFCPAAELVDDAGNVFKGRDEIAAIYTKFIEQFPGAKMELDIESLRFAASGVAIEDGTRTVITADGADSATNRYTMVHIKRDGLWTIASARELPADPEPTPRERLQPLAWLVGEWMDENAEVSIAISCRWAESENFLLLDFDARNRGQSVMKSTQRIGWDPLTGRVRSWVFDSDGGYGRGDWTQVEDRWIIKSNAVLPSGVTGSATIVVQPEGDDKFIMAGFDRVLGNAMESDFEAVIVRIPPQPIE